MSWQSSGSGGLLTKTGVTIFDEYSPVLVTVARQAVLFYPVPEGARVDAEDLGGAPAAGDDPVGLPEDLQDVIALHVFQARLCQPRGLLRWGRTVLHRLRVRTLA